MPDYTKIANAGQVIVPLVIEIANWLKNLKGKHKTVLTPAQIAALTAHLQENADLVVAANNAWMAAHPVPTDPPA